MRSKCNEYNDMTLVILAILILAYILIATILPRVNRAAVGQILLNGRMGSLSVSVWTS